MAFNALGMHRSDVLVTGRILLPGEQPDELLDRIVDTFFAPEVQFGTQSAVVHRLKADFRDLIMSGACIPGTPGMTNAGRQLPLSSCAVAPTLDLTQDGSLDIVRAYYQKNMGLGFNLSGYDDPVGHLLALNKFCDKETQTGQYQRYIGNMAMLSCFHPHVLRFIRAKKEHPEITYFNLSVDVTEAFMEAALSGTDITLSDGTLVNASDILDEIATSAWETGDPGIVFLDRMNRDNPVSHLPYTSVPTCCETGMVPGETNQLGYINVAHFLTGSTYNYGGLTSAVKLMTRALDNAVQASLNHFPHAESRDVAQSKRRLGIGICGLSDLLILMGLNYDSDESRSVARDILSAINFGSKEASFELASSRGSCGAMEGHNAYTDGRYLEDKFGLHPTAVISADDWTLLAESIRQRRQLRNILTTTLPPTGRSSLLLGVSPSLEPALKTAHEVPSRGHLLMMRDLVGTDTGVFDESASKTVNMPRAATVSDVREVFVDSYKLGLKNICVYRKTN
ncbi:hypothetical protein COW94_04340 [Candidatus Peregrinibacteria bacterium CG22_combo_CG10-13_8_21_14_all_44_10]|nr:MAG: hypothetical protein COW94_04340 [Candidatus Peregrinibacteria bacterium CG22_combo_CG10-13_8_21_14_all_44_10]PIS04414.1 MAG: hypothetical protein COT83_00690 [Candidatus Peregrinibacteria bacterium CG10_big_fil_rev_8_21_14_0_10_44_7]PJB89250.1 MAG: hypothetical protein CO082_01690 [Candidatus Peregrinibacteria bacterium CG_4_9_14_0_8_um_filter_44_15]